VQDQRISHNSGNNLNMSSKNPKQFKVCQHNTFCAHPKHLQVDNNPIVNIANDELWKKMNICLHYIS
jgi:hypothetical protein